MGEPLLYSLPARRLLGALKKEGGKIIAPSTLAHLITKEALPSHVDPFGSGRRVFLESELRGWWARKLMVSTRPIPCAGRPRKVRT
jgi:hypothetical protein